MIASSGECRMCDESGETTVSGTVLSGVDRSNIPLCNECKETLRKPRCGYCGSAMEEVIRRIHLFELSDENATNPPICEECYHDIDTVVGGGE